MLPVFEFDPHHMHARQGVATVVDNVRQSRFRCIGRYQKLKKCRYSIVYVSKLKRNRDNAMQQLEMKKYGTL